MTSTRPPAKAASAIAARPSRASGTRGASAPSARAWVVTTWVATRALLALVLAYAVATTDKTSKDPLNVYGGLSQWDVRHFIAIADNGYADPKDMAFFPGWPMVLRALGFAGSPGSVVLATGVALICSALAAWALTRIGGPLAAVAWLAAPMTVFTFAAYTEAPFCAAAFWAWERARAGRWGWAALLAAVASSMRISGLFLVGALALLALFGDGRPVGAATRPAPLGRWRSRFGHLLWLVLPVAVIGGYFAYLHSITGSWSAWFDAQAAGWQRGYHSPIDAFRKTWSAAQASSWPDRPLVARVFQLEIVTMGVGVVSTVILLALRRWASAGWVGVQVAVFATSTWYLSINRAELLWFPVFVLIGQLLAWGFRSRHQAGFAVLVFIVGMVDLAVMAWWAWLFFTGRWAS